MSVGTIVTDTYTYDAFGAVTHTSGTSANYWLFTGEQRDSESGFYYLRARYYDPAVGRLLTPDPVPGLPTVPQTFNLYPYALNDPVNRGDPTGLLSEGGSVPFTIDCLIFFIAAAGFIAGAFLGGFSGLAASLLATGIIAALQQAQGEEEARARAEGFAGANAGLFAFGRIFPERASVAAGGRLGFGLLGILLTARSCARS